MMRGREALAWQHAALAASRDAARWGPYSDRDALALIAWSEHAWIVLKASLTAPGETQRQAYMAAYQMVYESAAHVEIHPACCLLSCGCIVCKPDRPYVGRPTVCTPAWMGGHGPQVIVRLGESAALPMLRWIRR